MAPKRKASAKKQQPITQHALPLLKKPMEQIGKQINVPGSFWDGRMSTDERNTSYKSVPAEVDHHRHRLHFGDELAAPPSGANRRAAVLQATDCPAAIAGQRCVELGALRARVQSHERWRWRL